MQNTFLHEFKNHINDRFSFLLRSKLLIACSGGLDSVVLAKLCNLLGLKFSIAHCNFNLRGKESDEDEAFVAQLAYDLDVSFHKIHFDTKKYAEEQKVSIQMAARTLRYDWFKKLHTDSGFDFILTAHHADDNLETFLINLSRGTGIEGLVGIPEVNDIFIRPLLLFSRDQILDYATHNNLVWREDSSNSDTKYLRNKIRHKVVPDLKTLSPQFLSNFKTTIGNLKQTNEFVKSQVKRIKNEILQNIDDDTLKIPIHKLREYGHPKTCLYFLLNEYGFKAWNDVEHMLTAQSGKQIFSETHRLVKDRDYLLITKVKAETTNRDYNIPEAECMLMIPSGTLKIKPIEEVGEKDLKTIYVDKEKLKYPLTVRKWKEGDYFYPFGMKGKKKLSKYFKDEKLSLLAKERIWLLCSGKDIVWIINYRADNRFKIMPQTKQVLKITIT
ncbi:tRNA lysidine(34) synthetase TilS [Aquimarina algicola]|uniref:tRNA(Ile)-lysidine synthase n=1 Tax=Aquimarina algicola TaxID=2589995 RepID=A0A504IVY5_9FLAO|nr:tRNA lysidine(34) synthetase TilS [Aquimarina algicola]TPN82174.1 tRNA lysidine(34) synthetase TilS [Aquimarina algicola]